MVKSIPIIVILDIIILLLFYYMSLPHEERELEFRIEWGEGLQNSTILEATRGNGEVDYFSYINGGFVRVDSNPFRAWFGGFECDNNSGCWKYVSLIDAGNYNRFLFVFSDTRVILPAVSSWYKYCDEEEGGKCNGKLYLNSLTGESFLCYSDGFFYAVSHPDDGVKRTTFSCDFFSKEK